MLFGKPVYPEMISGIDSAGNRVVYPSPVSRQFRGKVMTLVMMDYGWQDVKRTPVKADDFEVMRKEWKEGK